MRGLQIGRVVLLGAATFMSAVIFVTSAMLNSRSTPKFHHATLLFPFILALFSIFIYAAMIFIGRARKDFEQRRLYMPPFVEFPIIGIMSLIWGSAAHVDSVAWYPGGPVPTGVSYLHCNLLPMGSSATDPATGLNIRRECFVLRTTHGTSWLLSLITVSAMALAGLFYLYFLATRGWSIVWMPISEATLKKPATTAKTNKGDV